MDSGGVEVQALYPNIAGFGGEKFLSSGEPELMLDCVRAYNDFLLEWVSVAPQRFITIASLPFWDVEAAVTEIERVAGLGFNGLLFGAPDELGMPFLADPTGHASGRPQRPPACLSASTSAAVTSRNQSTRNDSPSKAGVASTHDAPPVVPGRRPADERLAAVGDPAQAPRTEVPHGRKRDRVGPLRARGGRLPLHTGDVRRDRPWFTDLNEYFQRQCFVSYWFERAPTEVFDRVPFGVDNICFETDFPHPTCLWGDEVQDHIDSGLRSQTEEIRRKVTWENTADLYGLSVPRPVSA